MLGNQVSILALLKRSDELRSISHHIPPPSSILPLRPVLLPSLCCYLVGGWCEARVSLALRCDRRCDRPACRVVVAHAAPALLAVWPSPCGMRHAAWVLAHGCFDPCVHDVYSLTDMHTHTHTCMLAHACVRTHSHGQQLAGDEALLPAQVCGASPPSLACCLPLQRLAHQPNLYFE